MNSYFIKYPSKIYFVIILATALLVAIFPLKISNGCWNYDPYYVGYSILHPNISQGNIEKPFVFTYTYFGGFWNNKDVYLEKKLDKNILEWQHFFLKYQRLRILVLSFTNQKLMI